MPDAIQIDFSLSQLNQIHRSRMMKTKEKPKDTGYVLKRLGAYLLHYKWLLLLALALTIAGNSLALVGPMLSGPERFAPFEAAR